VVLGSEMSGGVRAVRVSDCEFVGTDRGFRFKTRRGRGGFLEDFRAERVTMERVGTPIAVNMYYEYTGADGRSPEVQDRGPRPVTPSTPWIRDLHFENVTARQSGCAAAFVLGLPEQPVANLSLVNVHLHMADEAVPDRPEMAVGIERVSRQGFHCATVTGLRLENVHVENQSGEPFVLQNAR
jgi:polygalacturonase